MPAAPILFCSHVVEIGGAEAVLLDLLRALDRTHVLPHLACPGDGPLPQAARALGVTVHPLAIGGRDALRKVLSLPGAARSLRRLAARLDARVVVATTMIAGYAGVLAQHQDLACVWHLHIVTRSFWARRFVRRAARVIAPSRQALLAIGADFATSPRALVLRNGVDDRFFQAQGNGLRQRLGIAADTPLLGIVGRLDPQKGHEVLLRAFAQLRGQPAPHLVIAGGELFAGSQPRIGGFGDRLRARIAELGVGERVHMLGHVADTAPLLAELDLVVVPSIAAESAPRAIAEAQAAGCCVVASDVGGVGEMLEDGRTGLLVPAADPVTLATALGRLLADGRFRAALADAGREHAAACYPMASFASRFGHEITRAVDP